MKHRRRNRYRAALLASLVAGGGPLLGAGNALGRDIAGPELPRPAESAASPPTAPAPASAADAERAKQLYALGAEAFAAQRNAEAIGYFRRAAELVPSPKLTYNIGLAYEEMGDAGRALAEYRSYLTQERAADASRIDEIRGRIATLERRLAETGVQQLFISSEPPGASVRIGGRARGVTPWAGELAPGHHVVQLDLEGYTPRQADVTLAAEHASVLALALAPDASDRDNAAPRGSARISPLTWMFLGVGVGGLGGGLAFELSRASSRRHADRAVDAVAAAEASGAADAKQMASLILFGFGAGFSIGGAILLAVDLSQPSAPSTEPALALPCTPGFCGLMTQGRF
jgi:tetratricopeptide (TPR) repeat protein